MTHLQILNKKMKLHRQWMKCNNIEKKKKIQKILEKLPTMEELLIIKNQQNERTS